MSERRPIRTAGLEFDLDCDGLLIVERATIEARRMVRVNIAPGGARRGKNITVHLHPDKARELARQLVEVADSTQGT